MFRVLLFFLSTCSSMVFAQDVTFRTGDHPNFVRVFVAFPIGSNWDISQIEGGYSLSFRNEVQIDAENFFEKISRTRISRIVEDSSKRSIVFELACKCKIETQVLNEAELIIDFRDPEPLTKEVVPTTGIEVPFYSNVEDQESNVVTQADNELQASVTASELSMDLPIIVEPISNMTLQKSNPIDPFQRIIEDNEKVEPLEAALSIGLNSALQQGLLDSTGENDARTKTGDDLDMLLAEIDAAIFPGISTRSILDSNPPSSTRSSVEKEQETICYHDDLVDIDSWASGDPFVHQIGDLRSKVTEEFDKTAQDSIEALARAYIYFGFGREAIEVLSIDGVESQERQVLKAIAQIVDGDQVELHDFELQMNCPGRISIWGFLAHEREPLTANPEVDEIIVAFRLLPSPLQEHIAPILAEKLNTLGFNDLASNVLSVARNAQTKPTEVAIVASEIASSQGDTEQSSIQLSELVEDDPRLPTNALLDFIDMQIGAGKPVKKDDILMLQVLRFESQEDDERSLLYAAEVRANIYLDRIEEALSLIEDPASLLLADEAIAYRDDITRKVVVEKDDLYFLEFIFSDSADTNNPELENMIAQRLISLGFSSQAEKYISAQAFGSYMMERRYLRAEVAISNGEFETARAHLAGLESARAQALLGATGIPLGPEALESLPENDRLSNNWQASNWESLKEVDDPLLKEVVERVEGEVVFSPSDQAPLSSGRELIAGSEALRKDMADLMQRFSVSSLGADN